MATMRAVQVGRAGGDFELVSREIPRPGAGEVLVKVEACGVCHGDAIVKDGTFPGIGYPRIPGHEVVGAIAELGPGTDYLLRGARVGVGWRGGGCGRCPACRRGDARSCENPTTTGISSDGGYAEYMVARADALVPIPDELASLEGAPLLCAGRTSFWALRSSSAAAGELVAVHGLGGLGHLAVQFAVKMGFRTVALSRGTAKKELAMRLGAQAFIDTAATDPAKELRALGGAKVILCTAPDAQAISALIGGLARGGQAVVVAASREPLIIPARLLVGSGRSIVGSGAGEVEEALAFSLLAGILPMIESFPLERAAEAYEKMMSAKALFRCVLRMGD